MLAHCKTEFFYVLKLLLTILTNKKENHLYGLGLLFLLLNSALPCCHDIDYKLTPSVLSSESIIFSLIQILNNLQGVTFDWKENKKKDIGFIAEDVGKHLPQIVQWETNQQDAQGLDYNKIIPILVEAIKTQQLQIDTLRDDLSYYKKFFPPFA